MLTATSKHFNDLQTLKMVKAYSGTKKTQSYMVFPETIEDCQSLIKLALNRRLTICPRGSGYSYADMILNDRHFIFNFSRLNRILSWDEESGQMVTEPGVRFSDVFFLGLQSNWTLGSCPGGMFVTIGGALSNNVHGKDSFHVGNFGEQVLEFKLLTAKNELLTVSPNQHPHIFKAAIGGGGLLGIIMEIKLQLRKIPSPFVEVTTFPVKNLHESLYQLEEAKKNSDFFISWVDAFAKNSKLGRGLVTKARWIEGKNPFSKSILSKSLTMPNRIFGYLPAKPTWKILSPLFSPGFMRCANGLNYILSQMRGKRICEMLFTDYNFISNRIPDINHVYHPHGFLEFEPLIPKQNSNTISELFSLCQTHKAESLLCGMKIHRKDQFLLSFSDDGYSIGVDIQLKNRQKGDVSCFAKDFFDLTCRAGGKIYIAKDEMLTNQYFKKMYPGFQTFLELKRQLDPEGLFSSDMYRRLFYDHS